VSDNELVSTKVPLLYTFVETAVFTRQLDELASIEMLYAIQSDLLADPERWPVIPGTKGFARAALPIRAARVESAAVFDTSTCI
jgi:hypothetical protein